MAGLKNPIGDPLLLQTATKTTSSSGMLLSKATNPGVTIFGVLLLFLGDLEINIGNFNGDLPKTS